ncbi:MAG: RHS repeat-associated core domain-containing protein [Pseudomonadota bacterium]
MLSLAHKLAFSTALTPANDNFRFRLVRNPTDASGNVTQAGATTYGYDALDRVNAENPGSSISYTYDATSNRLTKVSGGTTTTTVPSTSNKISAVGGNSYTYDAAGNITGDGVNTYTWNAAGNLATVNTTGGVYTYNAYNQRTKKVAGGNTTHYIYGAGGLLYGEYDTSGNFIREYVYLNGEPLAQINAGSPEVLTYLHPDHLGTPRFGTNAAGTQVWAWANDAFGTSTPSGSVTVNLRMPGQYYDSESGLFYNWNRYYNPAIGRYISSDPIGVWGGLNIFGYVGGNPINYIDPLGLKWTTADFVFHYYFGNGVGINLSDPEVDLAQEFETSSSVKALTERFINKEMENTSTRCGVTQKVFSDVTNEPDLFSIGHSTLFMRATCSAKGCSFNFYIRDWFANPLGVGYEMMGTKYRINHDWDVTIPYPRVPR